MLVAKKRKKILFSGAVYLGWLEAADINAKVVRVDLAVVPPLAKDVVVGRVQHKRAYVVVNRGKNPKPAVVVGIRGANVLRRRLAIETGQCLEKQTTTTKSEKGLHA